MLERRYFHLQSRGPCRQLEIRQSLCFARPCQAQWETLWTTMSQIRLERCWPSILIVVVPVVHWLKGKKEPKASLLDNKTRNSTLFANRRTTPRCDEFAIEALKGLSPTLRQIPSAPEISQLAWHPRALYYHFHALFAPPEVNISR